MREFLTKDQAIELIGGKADYVHRFVNAGPMLFGCDVGWDSFLETLDKAKTIEKSGETATKMNHPICLSVDNRHEFYGKA